jgi:O-antigen ligase
MVSVAARRGDRVVFTHAGILVAAVAMLAVAVAADRGAAIVAAVTIVLGAFLATYRSLVRWHTLLGLIVLIILLIPIRRYKLGGNLPFDLEPYRIAVALIVTLWIGALLADRQVRLRRSFLDGPLLLFLFAVAGSIVTNVSRIDFATLYLSTDGYWTLAGLSGDVLKKVLFLGSFFLVFYMVVSVVNNAAVLHAVLKTLVAGATGVAVAGIVEARTNYNVFDHVHSVIPGLSFQGALQEEGIARAGRLRVYASAEHPIALAAMFVMLVGIAIYLAKYTGRKRWALCAIVMGLGALATVSRTSVTMLMAVAVVFAWLRWNEVKKLWPLVLPALVVIHLLLPGTIGGLRQAFFPSAGLVQDQTVYGGRASSERLGPEFAAIGRNPLFGQGYGTRITDGERQNARVLDNEWLGTASETGLVGLFAWLWFMTRFIRRAGRESKRDRSPRGWLLAALTAAVAAFAVGMLTYDAFSFIQASFVLFILAGLGAVVMRLEPWPSGRRVVRAPVRLRRPMRQIS